MGYRLRMSAELGDWLAELCTSVPASAAEVGAAMTAVLGADDATALALVGVPTVGQADPREETDQLYQTMLEALQLVRRQVADAAMARDGAERLLAELDGEPQADPAVHAWLRQALDRARRRETEVTKNGRRLQLDVDRFRAAKESAKAMYTAAEASLRIHDAVETATGASQLPPGDDELAQLSSALGAAEANLQAVATQAYQTLHSLSDTLGPQAGKTPRSQAKPAAGLLELRADPLGRDVRLLLAIEPADAVMLLAALDGPAAIAEHYTEAVDLAGDLLADIRAGDWPPAEPRRSADVEVAFADSATFLDRFFPADADAIARRAADLSVGTTLARLRRDDGVSLADLAARSGIGEGRLRVLAAEGLRAAAVHEAVAIARALGGDVVMSAADHAVIA